MESPLSAVTDGIGSHTGNLYSSLCPGKTHGRTGSPFVSATPTTFPSSPMKRRAAVFGGNFISAAQAVLTVKINAIIKPINKGVILYFDIIPPLLFEKAFRSPGKNPRLTPLRMHPSGWNPFALTSLLLYR